MNIQVAVLCDAATDDNGKLNLLGAFDTIYTQQLPAIHPQCSIALRVTFSHEDESAHKLRLNFVDADGGSIMPGIDIPVEVVLPGDSHFGTRNFIVNIHISRRCQLCRARTLSRFLGSLGLFFFTVCAV